MREGTIIESYQGMFAKIISIKDGRYGLSAWVYKRDIAEAETVVAVFLNEFGISQVVNQEQKEGAEKPLDKMKAAELKAKAEALGLPGKGTNAELIVAITAKLAEEQKEGAE